MSPSKVSEDTVLKQVSKELRQTGALAEDQKQTLSKIFEKRLSQALALVEERKVAAYRFKPSGRIVWVVKGRKGQYQVMPDSMFCTCDDYYFRVMDNKRELCYHLVAQQIADALGKFVTSEARDSEYAELIAKWTTHTSSTRS